jgi:hypothetical protein
MRSADSRPAHIEALHLGLDDFARIMKSVDVVRLIVDGEHYVALANIDSVFGVIPFANSKFGRN